MAEPLWASAAKGNFAPHRRVQPRAPAIAEGIMLAGGERTDIAAARDVAAGRRPPVLSGGWHEPGTGSQFQFAQGLSASGEPAWASALAGAANGRAA